MRDFNESAFAGSVWGLQSLLHMEKKPSLIVIHFGFFFRRIIQIQTSTNDGFGQNRGVSVAGLFYVP